MDRIAVFVDAGYLFAQGSAAISGSKKARANLVLDPSAAITALKEVANTKAADCRLLRIYWYDGAIGGARPTSDQALLAHLDDVKLRLGFVNSHGEQKGVDSLIVTDLIELARLKSITDALLLSGDEDVRVGVQIAQNHGVRVHLLGIVPSRGSQSQQLLQEADTTTEWPATTIDSFLRVREQPVQEQLAAEVRQAGATVAVAAVTEVLLDVSEAIDTAVVKFVEELTHSDLQGIAAYWQSERGVPTEFDKKLLPTCRTAVGRDLERSEIRMMRARFQVAVKLRLDN